MIFGTLGLGMSGLVEFFFRAEVLIADGQLHQSALKTWKEEG